MNTPFFSWRKLMEFGIGAIALSTLILAGCGGGGGGSSGGSTSSSMTVSPSLGKLVDGTIVNLWDSTGAVAASGIVASGVVVLPVPGHFPLVVEITTSASGIPNATFCDEATGSNTVPVTHHIRAIIPDATTLTNLGNNVGVTPFTEIAAYQLLGNNPANITGFSSTSGVKAVTDINAALTIMNGNVNVLTPPTIVCGAQALGNGNADKYAANLALLSAWAAASSVGVDSLANTLGANLASGVQTPASVTQGLASVISASAVSGYVNANSGVVSTDLNNAATQLGNITGGSTLSGAASSVSTSVTNATQIASAKTMLSSFNTYVGYLGAGNNSGFLPTVASGVKADMSNHVTSMNGVSDFVSLTNKMLGVLSSSSSSASGVSTANVHGYNWPCYGNGSGTVTCQFMSLNDAGTMTSVHQISLHGGLTTNNLPSGTYTWTDSIVGTIDFVGSSSFGVNGVTIDDGTGNYCAQNLQNGNPVPCNSNSIATNSSNGYAVSQALVTKTTGLSTSVTGTVYANTGSSVFDNNGNFTSGTITLALNGNLLPKVCSSYNAGVCGGASIDHVNFNTSAGPAASTSASSGLSVSATASNGGANKSLSFGGGIYKVDSSNNVLASIVINSGSAGITNNNPSNLSVTATLSTPNYQFNGTLAASSFAQDANKLCTNGYWTSDPTPQCVTVTGPSTTAPGTTQSMPNSYPQSVTFTGSVKGIGSNSSIGTFLTTTGNNLKVTLGHSNYNPSAPKTANNYPTESVTFNGNIVDAAVSSTPFSVSLSADNGTYSSGGNLTLSYSDPGSNSISASFSGLGTQSGGSQVFTLGSTGVTILGGAACANTGICTPSNSTEGAVYSGYSNATSLGTLIGTVSNAGVVSFTDGSTQTIY